MSISELACRLTMWSQIGAAPSGAEADAVLREAESFGLGPPYYLGTGLLAIVLVVVHVLAPRIRLALSRRRTVIESFGGGFAAAYVFLHLLPELDEGDELLGLMIFVIPLLGFVTHYLLKRRFTSGPDRAEAKASNAFYIRLGNLAVYNGLLIYATPGSALESGWSVFPVTFALLLHIIASDFEFGEEFRRPFDAIGRYILALAVAAGCVAVLVFERTNEEVVDIGTAFLAGAVLYNVFRDETPEAGTAQVGWFLGGIVLFSGFVALAQL